MIRPHMIRSRWSLSGCSSGFSPSPSLSTDPNDCATTGWAGTMNPAGARRARGEACAHDETGWPDFNALLGGGEPCASACFFAFDLIQLDGEDLRRLPLIERYSRLCDLLNDAPAALKLCEHVGDLDPATVFQHACRLGLEGIVAKKTGSIYRSGRCSSWVKVKNPSYTRTGMIET